MAKTGTVALTRSGVRHYREFCRAFECVVDDVTSGGGLLYLLGDFHFHRDDDFVHAQPLVLLSSIPVILSRIYANAVLGLDCSRRSSYLDGVYISTLAKPSYHQQRRRTPLYG